MNEELKAKYEKMIAEAKAPGSGCSDSYIAHLQDILDGNSPPFTIDRDGTRTLYTHFEDPAETMSRVEKQRITEDDCPQHSFDKLFDFSIYSQCKHCGALISHNELK